VVGTEGFCGKLRENHRNSSKWLKTWVQTKEGYCRRTTRLPVPALQQTE